MIPRVFVGSDNINNNIALIDGSDVNYLKNVQPQVITETVETSFIAKKTTTTPVEGNKA